MNKLSEKLRFKLLEIALLATLLTSSVTFAQNEDFPKHLMLARELLVNVSKDKNRYTHTDQISFPSDRFSSGYAMNADCSGFVAAFLSRSASVTLNQMVKVTGNRTRPLSEDFHALYFERKGFQASQQDRRRSTRRYFRLGVFKLSRRESREEYWTYDDHRHDTKENKKQRSSSRKYRTV